MTRETIKEQAELLGINVVGNSFKITDAAKEKLDFILKTEIASETRIRSEM
jgi:hypothetical protein